MKKVTACAAAIAMMTMGLSPSLAQAQSDMAQILPLIAQAELLDAKCDAFTLEGQFVFQEMKRRAVNGLNKEWFDSLSRRDAPYFEDTCSALAKNPKITERADYFNNFGERLLALYNFLPPESQCSQANSPIMRDRAAAAWKARSGRLGASEPLSAMQQEAALLETQCGSLNRENERISHLGTGLGKYLLPAYQRGPRFKGEAQITGNHTEITTRLAAYRDPDKKIANDAILAGMWDRPGLARMAILTDGRMAVLIPKAADHAVQSVAFTIAGSQFKAASAKPLDSNYSALFILDTDSSNAVLNQKGLQPTFGVKFFMAGGAEVVWEEEFEYQGRNRSDRGTSMRPVRFDPVAFRNAVNYSQAVKFQ